MKQHFVSVNTPQGKLLLPIYGVGQDKYIVSGHDLKLYNYSQFGIDKSGLRKEASDKYTLPEAYCFIAWDPQKKLQRIVTRLNRYGDNK